MGIEHSLQMISNRTHRLRQHTEFKGNPIKQNPCFQTYIPIELIASSSRDQNQSNCLLLAFILFCLVDAGFYSKLILYEVFHNLQPFVSSKRTMRIYFQRKPHLSLKVNFDVDVVKRHTSRQSQNAAILSVLRCDLTYYLCIEPDPIYEGAAEQHYFVLKIRDKTHDDVGNDYFRTRMRR